MRRTVACLTVLWIVICSLTIYDQVINGEHLVPALFTPILGLGLIAIAVTIRPSDMKEAVSRAVAIWLAIQSLWLVWARSYEYQGYWITPDYQVVSHRRLFQPTLEHFKPNEVKNNTVVLRVYTVNLHGWEWRIPLAKVGDYKAKHCPKQRLYSHLQNKIRASIDKHQEAADALAQRDLASQGIYLAP